MKLEFSEEILFFEKGIKGPIFLAKIISETKIKNDILKIYNND